jgi:hypothetical protein
MRERLLTSRADVLKKLTEFVFRHISPDTCILHDIRRFGLGGLYAQSIVMEDLVDFSELTIGYAIDFV